MRVAYNDSDDRARLRGYVQLNKYTYLHTYPPTYIHTYIHLSVGCVMAMVAGKKPHASTPYLARGRDGALSLTIGCSTRHSLDPFARAKFSLLSKTHGPSARELAG